MLENESHTYEMVSCVIGRTVLLLREDGLPVTIKNIIAVLENSERDEADPEIQKVYSIAISLLYR